jgi:hypothetical protein
MEAVKKRRPVLGFYVFSGTFVFEKLQKIKNVDLFLEKKTPTKRRNTKT